MMVTSVGRLIWQTQGQDLIEYALLASFVSLAVMGAVIALGIGIGDLSNGVFGRAATTVKSGT